MDVKIKVEKFLMRQGIRVGKAAIEFTGDGPLKGFHLVGFTICDDPQKNNRYVMFPMAKTNPTSGGRESNQQGRNFFFLRPERAELLDELQDAILDVYESVEDNEFKNVPRLKQAAVPLDVV